MCAGKDRWEEMLGRREELKTGQQRGSNDAGWMVETEDRRTRAGRDQGCRDALTAQWERRQRKRVKSMVEIDEQIEGSDGRI